MKYEGRSNKSLSRFLVTFLSEANFKAFDSAEYEDLDGNSKSERIYRLEGCLAPE